MERPRLVVLPGGRAEADAGGLSSPELQVIPGNSASKAPRRAIDEALENVRRVQRQIQQRIVQALEESPPPGGVPVA